MTDDPSQDRLADLDRRLKQVENQRRSTEREPPVSPARQMSRMGVDLVAGAIMGTLLGLTLDSLLGTSPFGLIILVLIGFAAGVRNSFREAQRMSREQAQKDAQDRDI